MRFSPPGDDNSIKAGFVSKRRCEWYVYSPEEQHGFRKGRRVEEHLLTANLIIDKSFACNLPMWIISLDLSKAFDRVDWDALWDALRHHGVSEHIIWILQIMYHDQKGLIHDASKSSREFPIKGGVRQGCVLSPRLFCAVLQVALANWRARVEHRGVDMNDGLPRLLDLRFADDLLLFASTSTDASYLLDEICAALRQLAWY